VAQETEEWSWASVHLRRREREELILIHFQNVSLFNGEMSVLAPEVTYL
jgi:hypothetical protein